MGLRSLIGRHGQTDSSGQAGGADCNGCAVCTLSCPVWRSTHDLSLTFCGRMRMLQAGAGAAELKASVDACVLCGSCAPVCSFGVETVERTLLMRSEMSGAAALKARFRPGSGGGAAASGQVLIAHPGLRSRPALLERTLSALGAGFSVHEDDGADIADALEAGVPVSPGRMKGFLGSLSHAREVVAADGLIFRILRHFMPGRLPRGLGETMLEHAGAAAALGPLDLYVIDARTYHADFGRLLAFYDGLRRRTGCMMNLDLHRVATPTGAPRSGSARPAPLPQGRVVDARAQAGWILEGRPARRIIIEALEDVEHFRAVSPAPVIFVAEAI